MRKSPFPLKFPHDSHLAGQPRARVTYTNRPNLLQTFPFAFEDMGSWEDPTTLRSKNWVRFFHTDPRRQTRQRQDEFSRIFDSIDHLIFMCNRRIRTELALEPRGGGHWDKSRGYWFWVHEALTREDREQIAGIVKRKTK